MPATYEPIASTTLGSNAASITFSDIPGTYTDLILMGRGIAAADSGINMQLNGDTASNYSYTYLYGDGSSVISGRQSTQNVASGGRLGSSGAVSVFHIMSYANTNVYKTILSTGDNAGAITIRVVSLWRSTAAVTSLSLTLGSGGNFSANSTFSLYGIKAA